MFQTKFNCHLFNDFVASPFNHSYRDINHINMATQVYVDEDRNADNAKCLRSSRLMKSFLQNREETMSV